MTHLLNQQNRYDISVMLQIAKLIEFIAFDIMLIALNVDDSILIFYFSTPVTFSYGIK
jgi:hypothetical protein